MWWVLGAVFLFFFSSLSFLIWVVGEMDPVPKKMEGFSSCPQRAPNVSHLFVPLFAPRIDGFQVWGREREKKKEKRKKEKKKKRKKKKRKKKKKKKRRWRGFLLVLNELQMFLICLFLCLLRGLMVFRFGRREREKRKKIKDKR